MIETILVTGAAGFIGSHTCLALLEQGFRVVALDNYCNSSPESLRRVNKLARSNSQRLIEINGDIRDAAALKKLFAQYEPSVVIHFAGLKAVGESVATPLAYYDNNVAGSICLLEASLASSCRKIIFSSTATVYGNPERLPITEDSALGPTNPYGQSKLMVENVIRDLASARTDLRYGILRYFNPVGAHKSGMIGEDPNDTPNNLFPFITQVLTGKLSQLNIFGSDWPTPDGTGVRDYIHVTDLVDAHLSSLKALLAGQDSHTLNLGVGTGYSVLDVLREFEKVTGKSVPYQFADRRSGDVACCYSDPSLALRTINWQARLGLTDMCADAWKWQSMNPLGYSE